MYMQSVKTHMLPFSIIAVLLIAPLMLFSQMEQWVYQYNGGSYNFPDAAKTIGIGTDGNIYAAGFSKDSSWRDDFAVVSLTPAGTERWTYRYYISGSTSNIVYSLVCGTDGNIYAAGQTRGPQSTGLCVVSLDQNGNERWVYQSDGTTEYWECVSSIIRGADGNFYVAGESNRIGNWGDFTVLSLDTNGNERWIYRYNGAVDQCDWAEALVFGTDNNIYAAGWSNEVTGDDITVISLDQNGSERWVYRYNGAGNGVDKAHSITYGLDGNIYVAGEIESNGPDYVVISLDQTGIERWIYTYNGTGNNGDAANSIIYGSDGNIYTAGYSCLLTYDMLAISLDQDGSERWVCRYDSPGLSQDNAHSIIYGLDGYLYVAGCSRESDKDYDITALSLDTAGNERWVYQYNGPADEDDRAYCAAFGADGSVYIAGFSTDQVTNLDFTVISLDPTTAILESEVTEIKKYKGASIFSGQIPVLDRTCYKIFDITGRQIHTLNPAPGIYFVEADGEIVHKIIKIK